MTSINEEIFANMPDNVSPYSDAIDTRNVIARMEEIADEYLDMEPDSEALYLPREAWTVEHRTEHDILSALIEECRSNADNGDSPEDGMFLYRETYWVEYMRDFAQEMYESAKFKRYNHRTYRDEEMSWAEITDHGPFAHIDWQAYADHMRRSCPEIEYGPDNMTYILFI